MKLQVLISTMHQNDFSLLEKMNINSEAIVINQCDREEYDEFTFRGHKIKWYSVNERGLSRSRNMALRNSDAEVCVIADDDLVYNDDYVDKIKGAYKKFDSADIIAFDVRSTSDERNFSMISEGKVGFPTFMKICSVQITFKRSSLEKHNLKFNELFGAGSKYTCGEENILLADCISKNLRIQKINQEISTISFDESTWFIGFDELFFQTKGAVFYEINPLLVRLLILQFAIRKRRLYGKDRGIYSAYKNMISGMKEYKKIKKLN